MQPVETAILVDLVVIAVVVLYAWYGWRRGARHSIGGVAGALLGVAAAFFITPAVTLAVANAVAAAIISTIACSALALGGHFAGVRIARAFSTRHAHAPRDAAQPIQTPRSRDHAVGALAYGVVAVSIVSMIVLATGHVATALAPRSLTLRIVHAMLPAEVIDAYATLRSTTKSGTAIRPIDVIAEFERPAPTITAAPAAVDGASGSIVKVMGTAWDCGQGLFGTGLVVAPERVVTNAHVVAGISEVIVTAPGEFAVEGSVVYFDPLHDLAIIAVPGLSAEPLKLDDVGVEGEDAFVAGYPNGGSFSATPAVVLARTTGVAANIYGTEGVVLEYLTIAGSVPPGTSGSPLVTVDGSVAGLVFARADESNTIGYVLAVRHLAPVVERAAGYIIKVDAGPCLAR